MNQTIAPQQLLCLLFTIELGRFTSLFTYTQHTIQYDMRQQIHVHTILQVVCCWVQNER